MVTLQQALENIHSNNDVEMKKITPIITDFLVSYRGAIYISFVSRFYTCKVTYLYMFKIICNGSVRSDPCHFSGRV